MRVRQRPACALAAAMAGLLLAGFDHRGYAPAQVDSCLTCHPRERPTHAVGDAPPSASTLPLGPQGEVVCLSCHDCERARGACRLRAEPAQLCRACHDCEHGMACLLDVVHLGCDHDLQARLRDCLTCHDGTLAPEAGGRPGEHPTDIAYPLRPDFEPLPDPRIRLVDARVTCVACHDPYRPDGARLSLDNARSRLCLACHRR